MDRELGPREQAVVELLLEGCDNEEIGKRLGMALRTVKAHMNRMFLRYQIQGGVKRVKLAVLLYKERRWKISTEAENSQGESAKLSYSSRPDSKTAKSASASASLRKSSKIIFESSTTNSVCRTGLNLHSGTSAAMPSLCQLLD